MEQPPPPPLLREEDRVEVVEEAAATGLELVAAVLFVSEAPTWKNTALELLNEVVVDGIQLKLLLSSCNEVVEHEKSRRELVFP